MFKSLKTLALLALVGVTAACTQVSTGNIGVESTLSQVKKEELAPGGYLTVFKTVTEVNGKEITASFDNLKPKSKDNLTMADLDVDILYRVDPSKAADIMTRWSGDVVQVEKEDGVRVGHNYVYRQAREAVYAAIAEMDAATINGNREALKGSIVNKLQAELDKDAGKGWFYITGINVRSVVTDASLENSIKAAAQRDYEIAAKKKEVELARADAERRFVEAQGEARANEVLNASITPNLIRMRELTLLEKKWNGVGPSTVVGNSGVTPTLTVGR